MDWSKSHFYVWYWYFRKRFNLTTKIQLIIFFNSFNVYTCRYNYIIHKCIILIKQVLTMDVIRDKYLYALCNEFIKYAYKHFTSCWNFKHTIKSYNYFISVYQETNKFKGCVMQKYINDAIEYIHVHRYRFALNVYVNLNLWIKELLNDYHTHVFKYHNECNKSLWYIYNVLIIFFILNYI